MTRNEYKLQENQGHVTDVFGAHSPGCLLPQVHLFMLSMIHQSPNKGTASPFSSESPSSGSGKFPDAAAGDRAGGVVRQKQNVQCCPHAPRPRKAGGNLSCNCTTSDLAHVEFFVVPFFLFTVFSVGHPTTRRKYGRNKQYINKTLKILEKWGA